MLLRPGDVIVLASRGAANPLYSWNEIREGVLKTTRDPFLHPLPSSQIARFSFSHCVVAVGNVGGQLCAGDRRWSSCL